MRLAALALSSTLLLAACGGDAGPAPARHDGLEAEPNDSLATATDGLGAARDGWIAGRIGAAGDVDVFRIVVPADAAVVLVATTTDPGQAGCTGIDTVVELLDGGGAALVRSDDDGAGLCGRAARQLGQGTWYVRVSAYGAADVLDYALHLELVAPGVEREPNDTSAGALAFEALAVGGVVRGALEPAGDVDLYRIDLPRGGALTFSLTDKDGGCSRPGPVLALVGGAGTVVALPPGCGPTTTSVGPGPWFLEVFAPAVGLQVEYRLQVAATPYDELEPNDGFDVATPYLQVAVPAPGDGTMARGALRGGDADVFSLVAPAGTLTTVAVSLSGGAGLGCPTGAVLLEAYDQAFTPVASAGSLFDAGCPALAVEVPPGLVYLRLRTAASAADFGYALRVVQTSAALDEREPNDVPATATRLPSSGVGVGLLSTPGDVDVWRITLDAPFRTIQTFAMLPGGLACTGEAVVSILGADGAVLATSGASTCGMAYHWATAAGTYYLRVEGGPRVTGHLGYQLDVFSFLPAATEDEPNGTPATATRHGAFDYGAILPAGDLDHWAFDLAGQPLVSYRLVLQDSTACMESAGALTVLDAALVEVGAEVGHPELGQCALISGVALPGRLYARVAAAPGAVPTLAYTLDATFQAFTPLEEEPNGGVATASSYPWAGDARTLGAIWPAGDVDVWRLEVPRDGLLLVRAADLEFYCASEPLALELLDAGGAPLPAEPSNPFCSTLERRVTAGTYHLRIAADRISATAPYWLTATLQ